MRSTLRLKMSVQSVKRCADAAGNINREEINLDAVSGNDNSINAQWAKYTPFAHLTMQIDNPDAYDKLLPGQYVFVDISPAKEDD